ncbi:MAG: hypothetical protein KGL75_11070, partial [Acidobacteriota bacterium]|nr:hypothetical protein [Acidobacteriota bacterium]
INDGFVAPASRRRFSRTTFASFIVAGLVSIAALIGVASPIATDGAGSDLIARSQPLGKPLHVILELGEQYESGDELYDAEVTVVKVLRGEPAEAVVKSAGAAKPPPPKGYEYLAARVRFTFSARAMPSHFDYTVDASQFSSVAPDGSAYPSAPARAQPSESLHATLRSGGSAEGWVLLLVPRADRTPLMLFVPNTGTTSHTGDSWVFRLYDPALGSSEKSS